MAVGYAVGNGNKKHVTFGSLPEIWKFDGVRYDEIIFMKRGREDKRGFVRMVNQETRLIPVHFLKVTEIPCGKKDVFAFRVLLFFSMVFHFKF